MTDAPQEEIRSQTKVESTISHATSLVHDKRFRSLIWLILSFFVVLSINSLLPVLEGEAHYTAAPIEVTHDVYKQMKNGNTNYRLTWVSEQMVILYLAQYRINHPELTEEESALLEVPQGFKVSVYTKFFFESTFWYISTAISIGSAIILFYALLNVLLIYAKEKDKKYLKYAADVDELVDKTLDPTTFEPWMDNVFNRKRKISQHQRNVRFKLDKLYKKTNYEIRRGARNYFKKVDELKNSTEYNDLDESDLMIEALRILKGKKLFKLKVKHYIKQHEKLLTLLDAKYIDEYVIDGRVQHFKYIYPMFVYSGSSHLEKTTDSYSNIKTDVATLKKDAVSKILYSVIIVLLFAVAFTVTAISSYQQDPFWIIINVIGKIAPLLLQIPLAIDYSSVFMDKQIVSNLIHRRDIGMLYAADLKTMGRGGIDAQTY